MPVYAKMVQAEGRTKLVWAMLSACTIIGSQPFNGRHTGWLNCCNLFFCNYSGTPAPSNNL